MYICIGCMPIIGIGPEVGVLSVVLYLIRKRNKGD